VGHPGSGQLGRLVLGWLDWSVKTLNGVIAAGYEAVQVIAIGVGGSSSVSPLEKESQVVDPSIDVGWIDCVSEEDGAASC